MAVPLRSIARNENGIAEAVPILKARFGERCQTGEAIRAQHGHTTTWIANEPPDAVVFVPIAAHVAEHYLDRELESSLTADKFNDPSRPRYLMFITRRAMYESLMRQAEVRLTPAFEIKRQRGTLLRIYRNGAPPAESAG